MCNYIFFLVLDVDKGKKGAKKARRATTNGTEWQILGGGEAAREFAGVWSVKRKWECVSKFNRYLARLRGIYLTPFMNHRLLSALKTSSQRKIYEVRRWDSQNYCSSAFLVYVQVQVWLGVNMHAVASAYMFVFVNVSVCVIMHAEMLLCYSHTWWFRPIQTSPGHSTLCTGQMQSL